MKFVKFKLWVNKYTKKLKEKTYYVKKYLRQTAVSGRFFLFFLLLSTVYKIIEFGLSCLALKNCSMTSWYFNKLTILAICTT